MTTEPTERGAATGFSYLLPGDSLIMAMVLIFPEPIANLLDVVLSIFLHVQDDMHVIRLGIPVMCGLCRLSS